MTGWEKSLKAEITQAKQGRKSMGPKQKKKTKRKWWPIWTNLTWWWRTGWKQTMRREKKWRIKSNKTKKKSSKLWREQTSNQSWIKKIWRSCKSRINPSLPTLRTSQEILCWIESSKFYCRKVSHRFTPEHIKIGKKGATPPNEIVFGGRDMMVHHATLDCDEEGNILLSPLGP